MTITTISPLDGGFLLLERKNCPFHVSILLEFTKPADAGPDFVPRLKEQMRGRHELTSPWNLCQVRGLSRLPIMKVVDELDLDHHVKLHTLPGPGGQRELGELVTELHAPRLSTRHPLFQIHLIDGLEGNRFAALLKGHHAIFDGTTFMRRLVRWLTFDPDERGRPPLFTVGPSGRVKAAPAEQQVGFFAAMRELRKAARDGRRGEFDGERLDAPYRLPKGLFRGKIDNRRRVSIHTYDLADVQALAKACGGTVNDVAMWLAGTSLRTYLLDAGQLPEEPLTAALAVNLRAPDDDRPGSAFGFLTIHLGTHIADPLERLTEIRRSIGTAKRQLATLSPRAKELQTLVVNGKAINGLMLGMGRFTPAAWSIGSSNVPGPPEPLYWEGARLDVLAPVHILMHNNALNYTFFSMAGRFIVSITGATKTVPHVQRMGAATDTAMAELKSLLLPPVKDRSDFTA